MKGYPIYPRFFTPPTLLACFLLFLTSALIAQTTGKLKRPDNLITADLSGIFRNNEQEFTLSYERKITEKTSFVGTLGFIGNQDPGTLIEGYEENEFTRKVASGWYDYYLLWFFHISGSYSNVVTYPEGYPMSMPEQTIFMTHAVYVKGGYKIHKINKYKIKQRAHWFFMPELMLAVQGYNHYEVTLTEEVINAYSGYTESWDGAESWRISEILQTREIRKEKRSQMVIGTLANLGYQQLVADRILLGLQGTVGLLIPTNKEKVNLGRGSGKDYYARFTVFAGFAF